MDAPGILVRGVNWLGDAVMTTPALLRLREAQPQARICLLTDSKLADLWKHHPAVDSILTFTKRQSVWSIARILREHDFQIGLALPNSPRSALELWLARIPRRIGYSRGFRRFLLSEPIGARPGAVEMRKRSLSEINRLIAAPNSPKPHPPASAHQVQDYLYLTSRLGASMVQLPPFIAVTEEEVQAVRDRWKLNETQPVFGLNPGAEYGPAKRWPKERFAAAAVEIYKRTKCRWIIFGGQGDIPVAAEIAGKITGAVRSDAGESTELPAVLNLAGQTSLRELCALLKVCRVLVTNDTGPMHVSAAVGTPVVVVYGSTSPELTAPGLPGDKRNAFLRANVPCSPCFLRECPIDFRCMRNIDAHEVVEAVIRAVGENVSA